MNTSRYAPIHFILHWLTVALLAGSALLARQKDMAGLPLNLHMVVGFALLIVMVTRVIMRFVVSIEPRPSPSACIIHTALYAAVFFILGMGGWIAYQRNLFGYLLDPTSAVGRGGFRSLGELHKMAWFVLLGLTLIHIGIMLYEQFFRKVDTLS